MSFSGFAPTACYLDVSLHFFVVGFITIIIIFGNLILGWVDGIWVRYKINKYWQYISNIYFTIITISREWAPANLEASAQVVN